MGVLWVILCSKANFMADSYYIQRNTGAVPEGPYTRAALADLVARKELPADVPVLINGQGAWCSYEQLPPVPPCPPTYSVWSFVSVFCCFPFSLIAVRQSARVAELYGQGRYEEAAAASRSALRWNLFFLVSVIILLAFCWFAFKFAYDVWETGRIYNLGI